MGPRRAVRGVAPSVGLVLLLLVLAGCHTVEGFGKDLSTIGGKLSSKAQEHTRQ